MTDLERLLRVLTESGVEFVVIDGVAMVLRGSSRVTIDLDLCYARDRENLRRLADALAPYSPRLRGTPPELPFLWDERTLASGLNFTSRRISATWTSSARSPGWEDTRRSRPTRRCSMS
jgi:hypothetical protein